MKGREWWAKMLTRNFCLMPESRFLSLNQALFRTDQLTYFFIGKNKWITKMLKAQTVYILSVLASAPHQMCVCGGGIKIKAL